MLDRLAGAAANQQQCRGGLVPGWQLSTQFCCLTHAAGKKASVAIYAHLAQKYGGSLSPAAAQEGLSLYDEVVADAKARPGAHPNIDILFEVLAKPELQISIQVDKQ